MRLFVAVEVDDAVRRACRRAAAEADAAIRTAVRTCDLKWVAIDNLHITVKFIGHVDEALGARILASLAAPFPCAAFEARLGGLGVFPPGGASRVVWVGLARGEESLRRVHEEVEGRLGELGIPRDDRPLSGHLTLARVREPVRGSGRVIREALGRLSVKPVAWPVSHVTLFESRLSPKGATYTPLIRSELAGSGDSPGTST
jgi:2'-5' RNA ligase